MADRRRALLVAALAFARLEVTAPELVMLHAWLDTWSGLGAIVVGMRRHGYDLWLKQQRERMEGDLPPPHTRPAHVGRPSAHVVADALESRLGGRVASIAHAVCSGLLAQRGESACVR